MPASHASLCHQSTFSLLLFSSLSSFLAVSLVLGPSFSVVKWEGRQKGWYLKVLKNENYFGSDFEFCTISLLVMFKYKGFVKNFFDWAIDGRDTIIPLSLRLGRIKFSLV